MLTRFHPLMIVMLVLAAIGFIETAIRNPVSLLFTLGILAAVWLVLRNYSKTGRFLPRFTSNPRKPKQTNKQTPIRNSKAKSDKRRAAFQVIEGSKGKTKPKDNNNEPKVYH